MCESRLKLCDYGLIGGRMWPFGWSLMAGLGPPVSSHVLRSERPPPGGGDGRQKGTDSEYFGVN